MRERNKVKGLMVSEKKGKNMKSKKKKMIERKEKSEKNEESEKGKIVKSERFERKSYFYAKEKHLEGAFLGKKATILIKFREVLLFETKLKPDLSSGLFLYYMNIRIFFPMRCQVDYHH